MEVTALQGTERESAEGLTRNSPGTADGKWGQSPLASAGSERAEPRGRPRRGRGHWTIRDRPGSGVWEPWCVGGLDPRVGEGAGSEKKRSRTVVRVGRVAGRGR